jgi:hypothetical protein
VEKAATPKESSWKLFIISDLSTIINLQIKNPADLSISGVCSKQLQVAIRIRESIPVEFAFLGEPFEELLAGGQKFLFLFDGRFLVMLALFQLGHDPGPFALLLEALEGGFNRLAIVEDDQRQINSLPFGLGLGRAGMPRGTEVTAQL